MSTHVKGVTGLLSVWDGSAYKPIVCITSTGMTHTANTTDKVNYCTQGKPETTVNYIQRSMTFDAEVMTLDVAEAADSYKEMRALMDTMLPQDFKVEGRSPEPEYFNASISELSDTYPAEGDATFSGTLLINGDIVDVDPHALP